MNDRLNSPSNSDLGYDLQTDAQACAQPDGPAYGFNLASVGAARRLA